MKIVIESIPNHKHRYPTVGDWWYDADGTLQIRVSKTEDPRHEMLIAIHEVFEALACWINRVPEPEVTEFDLWFEEANRKGEIPEHIQEPGMHPDCPYHQEHVMATAVEMILARQLDVSWADYEKEIIKLSKDYYKCQSTPTDVTSATTK